MAACWPLQGMSPAQKAVLISLADQANDDGVCWPSVNTIGLRTCLSERAVQAALKWLEEQGALLRDHRSQRSTMYTVTPQALVGEITRTVHYVYRITHTPSGQFYIGLRTCGGDPLEDSSYFGSGVSAEWLAKRKADCVKEIVASFEHRHQAAQFETAEIALAIQNPRCLNRKVSAPGSATHGRHVVADPADAAPAAPAPANGAPHPAASAPSTPQHLHLDGAASAPGTINEPSVEPSREPLPAAAPPVAAKGRADKAKGGEAEETALQAACRATWAAYAEAYGARYGARPVRNAQVNAKVKQFVQRIGYDEAPAVAKFYVERVADAYVTRECHPVGTLLQKAEGYRTQWAAGHAMTSTRARQMDQSQANFDAAEEAMAILRQRRGELEGGSNA